MGNENSKDGEVGADEPEAAEGPSGSEKDTEAKLPNGDIAGSSSSEEPGGATDGPKTAGDKKEREKEEENEDQKESSDVDEYTKRMTIISENVYHYVGLVSGREYAREKGLPAKEGDLPVAPLAFMQPQQKKQGAKASDGKTEGEPRKPAKDERLPKETVEAEKELDLPAIELPRLYQGPGEDKNKATEKSGSSSDAAEKKPKETVGREKVDKEKGGKKDGKPEKNSDSFKTQLPRFNMSQATGKEKEPGEHEKPTDVPSSKVVNKTQEKEEKKQVGSGKKADLQETKLPRFFQSDKTKAADDPDKSEIEGVPNGKAEDKKEKGKDVEKPSKGAPDIQPEKEVHTPATKIPRFNLLSTEDKKKASGESDTPESKAVSNGIAEDKAPKNSDKVGKTDTKPMALPRFFQSPNQDKDRTTGESEVPKSQTIPNGDAEAKVDTDKEGLDNKPVKEVKMNLPRLYPADNTEDISETDGKRYITALTVGPRSRKPEEPERKRPFSTNSIAVIRPRIDENQTTTVKNEEKTPIARDNLVSLESANDREPKATKSKSTERKEKSVRFEDEPVEETPPTSTEEPKRVTSMMFVAPIRSAKQDDRTCDAASVELTSPLASPLTSPLTSEPPPAYAELETEDDDYFAYPDHVTSMCGEEERRQVDKRVLDLHDLIFGAVHMTHDPEEEEETQGSNDTAAIFDSDKGPSVSDEFDDREAVEEMLIAPKSTSSLYSSSTPPSESESSLLPVHDVEEGAPNYDVHHLKQPVPRGSSEVDLGSGKILNAPSILMGSSITLSASQQKCETLPHVTTPSDDGTPPGVVHKSTKPVATEVKVKPPKLLISRQTGTAASREEDSVDGDERGASISGGVDASLDPSVAGQPLESRKSLCDNGTQTADAAVAAREVDTILSAPPPPVVRSRSVGFQCGVGDTKRAITMQKRPSLPSDSGSGRPTEIERKTRIPLAAATSVTAVARPAQPEVRKAKGSPLPDRKFTAVRREAPTTKGSPRTPPAATNVHVNDSSKDHKELAKRRSLPAQNTPGCSSHPTVVPRASAASPRVVRKRDDTSKSPMHKTTAASSKSMESIPRCTCLQLTGKDSPQGDKTLSRHPSNPLGLREYGFNPPSKKPHWR